MISLRKSAEYLAAEYDWAGALFRQPTNVWQFALMLRQRPQLADVADIDILYYVACSGSIGPRENKHKLAGTTRDRLSKACFSGYYKVWMAGVLHKLPLHYCFFDRNFDAALQGASHKLRLYDATGRVIDDAAIVPEAGATYYGRP